VPPQPVRYLGLTFSPDSQTVYYVSQKAGDEPGTLYHISVIGGTPQKINEHLDSGVSFSPDGRKYAFIRESATTSTLIVADLDSNLERTVVSRKLPEVLDYPGWSPDGRVIAFTDTDASVASPRGSNARLVQVRIADGSESDLSTQRWGFIRELAWLHDRRGLVISARSPEESGFVHLWYVSYPDGAARQITEGVYRQRGVSISADSREIITVQENAFSSIWRIRSLRDATPELVVSGESGTSAPVWTTGGRIVFEEELNGRRSIFSVNADGSNRKELTFVGNDYDASVSGNGRKLAFVSDRSGTPAIWTMDLENGNSQVLTKATGEPVPQLSPDGTWIAFTAIGAGHWTSLWKMPATGGQPTELNDRFWMRPVISPDGNWIAGFYDDRQLNTQTKPTSISVISSNGGMPRRVFAIPFSVAVPGGIRWSRDGQELCYIISGKEGANIWAQPLNGGAPHQITHFKGVDLFSFDWSPDGKQLAFSRGFQARDVMLVEDARRK
jgi:Tol biopolymer transport system component